VSLDSKETIAALNYAKELYPHMIGGNSFLGDPSNNKAFALGILVLTFNGVSIYYVAKNSTDPKAAGDRGGYQSSASAVWPGQEGAAIVAGGQCDGLQHTKYPNACKEYLRFMMEAPQYAPWLSGCLGYWSNSLKAYGRWRFGTLILG